jgi:uncharacterized cupredoxin-like copper-binding protein
MKRRVRRLPLIAGLATLTIVVAACGESSTTTSPDTAGTGTRTVDVAMEDIKFETTSLTVQAGETIDFRFTNTGKVAHDAFIGDNAAQMDHEAEMGQMGGTDDHATEEEALVLQPGESGELTYTFDKAGTFEVGCHQPGHYAAGMKIDVTVE